MCGQLFVSPTALSVVEAKTCMCGQLFVSPTVKVGEMRPDGSPVAEGAAWEPEPKDEARRGSPTALSVVEAKTCMCGQLFVSPTVKVGETRPDGSPVAEGAAREPEPKYEARRGSPTALSVVEAKTCMCGQLFVSPTVKVGETRPDGSPVAEGAAEDRKP